MGEHLTGASRPAGAGRSCPQLPPLTSLQCMSMPVGWASRRMLVSKCNLVPARLQRCVLLHAVNAGRRIKHPNQATSASWRCLLTTWGTLSPDCTSSSLAACLLSCVQRHTQPLLAQLPR